MPLPCDVRYSCTHKHYALSNKSLSSPEPDPWLALYSYQQRKPLSLLPCTRAMTSRVTNFWGIFFVLNCSHWNVGRREWSIQDTVKHFLQAIAIQVFCFRSVLNSMYLNCQKQEYFLSCCILHTGYSAMILQPICSTISHFSVLPR